MLELSIRWDKQARAETVQILAPCAITCKHWARRVRPRIVKYVQVRSAYAIARMKALLGAPPIPGLQPLTSLIEDISIIPTEGPALWIHNVALTLAAYPELSKRAYVRLVLPKSCPAPIANGTAVHSTFQHLPRFSPFICRAIHNLELQDIRFRQPNDFFRLLAEFRELRRLRVQDITWDDTSLHSFQSPHPLPRKLSSMIIESSGSSQLGDRNILPWVLSSVASCTPSNSRRTPESNVRVPPWDPSQLGYFLDSYEALVDPAVPRDQGSRWCVRWNQGNSKFNLPGGQ